MSTQHNFFRINEAESVFFLVDKSCSDQEKAVSFLFVIPFYLFLKILTFVAVKFYQAYVSVAKLR